MDKTKQDALHERLDAALATKSASNVFYFAEGLVDRMDAVSIANLVTELSRLSNITLNSKTHKNFAGATLHKLIEQVSESDNPDNMSDLISFLLKNFSGRDDLKFIQDYLNQESCEFIIFSESKGTYKS